MNAPRRTRPADFVRVAGRMALVAAVACVLGLVAMQFQSIVAKNVAIAHELSAAQTDVVALRARQVRQSQTIQRLDSAAGAIPEIHEKLGLVGKHEEIIFVRGATAATAAPDEYGASR